MVAPPPRQVDGGQGRQEVVLGSFNCWFRHIQLVEPHNHQVNAAEAAMKAAKYHIIAGLQTVDPDCPLQLWSKFTKNARHLKSAEDSKRRP